MLTLLLGIGVAWAATLGWLWWRTRLPAVRRRVLINCDDETAVRGILVEGHGTWLVVQQAELLRAEGPPTPLDGRTFIHRNRVLFLQVLP